MGRLRRRGQLAVLTAAVVMAAFLLCLSIIAAFVPAYRAGRLEPARVLRAE